MVFLTGKEPLINPPFSGPKYLSAKFGPPNASQSNTIADVRPKITYPAPKPQENPPSDPFTFIFPINLAIIKGQGYPSQKMWSFFSLN